MKDITPKLVKLFKEGYCTPQIARIAKKTKEPATTLHYNIKKLEKEGKIKSYKAVFDYDKINQGFCAFVLIKLNPIKYANPEDIASKLSNYHEVESVDMATGDFEMIIKLRTKNKDEYYELIKKISSTKGIIKAFSIVSLKQFKTEFVKL